MEIYGWNISSARLALMLPSGMATSRPLTEKIPQGAPLDSALLEARWINSIRSEEDTA